jgi:2-keto-4-pentenoate hydratase/2-oxohepta-3-ene-1,7-dioic acid hydratase in catechol pathway
MKLACATVDGAIRWGIVVEGSLHLMAEGFDAASTFADRDSLDRAAQQTHSVVSVHDAILRAPVIAPPQFIGFGLNYHDHAAEVGAAPPAVPVTFGFHRSAIIGPGDAVELPPFTAEVDWEAELAIVIGIGGRNIPVERSLDHVFGYTIVNDVSARDVQNSEGQWGRAKSFDTFKPMGPWIVTRDELGDATGLPIGLTVNGVTKQSSNTDQLIFGVPFLVSHLSRCTTLHPGMVISTGTPGGVGFTRNPPEYLRAGDHMAVTIGGIGTLTNPVSAADASVPR